MLAPTSGNTGEISGFLSMSDEQAWQREKAWKKKEEIGSGKGKGMSTRKQWASTVITKIKTGHLPDCPHSESQFPDPGPRPMAGWHLQWEDNYRRCLTRLYLTWPCSSWANSDTYPSWTSLNGLTKFFDTLRIHNTVMCHLTGTHSENCIIKQFHHATS
jgi:hypothetical protein